MNLKDHEKFIAFCLLGLALVSLAWLVYVHPLPDTNSNSSSIQIINTIVGALTLAFGGVANALFRITDAVKVANTPAEPLPTTDSGPTADAPLQPVDPQPTPAEELPDYAR